MTRVKSCPPSDSTCAGAAAIDVWSAGMILLFFLTKKFPLLQSNDDTEALMEIAMIIGRRKMETTATLHSAHLLAVTVHPLRVD